MKHCTCLLWCCRNSSALLLVWRAWVEAVASVIRSSHDRDCRKEYALCRHKEMRRNFGCKFVVICMSSPRIWVNVHFGLSRWHMFPQSREEIDESWQTMIILYVRVLLTRLMSWSNDDKIRWQMPGENFGILICAILVQTSWWFANEMISESSSAPVKLSIVVHESVTIERLIVCVCESPINSYILIKRGLSESWLDIVARTCKVKEDPLIPVGWVTSELSICFKCSCDQVAQPQATVARVIFIYFIRRNRNTVYFGKKCIHALILGGEKILISSCN